MITEEDISGIPGIVVMDGVYLLAGWYSGPGLSHKPIIDIYVDGGSCPYCGAPRRFWRPNGPGGWSYVAYTCGTKAAVRPAEHRDMLLAVSKPSTLCREYTSLVTAKDEDTI